MSWVISKHLNKGGGNNIAYRIGQFNKYTYSKFKKKQHLVTKIINSPKCKEIQQKLFRSRKANILNNTYSAIDEYTRAKRMYSSLHSKKFFKYIKKKNNTMRYTAPVWTRNPQAIGYGSSKPYHYPMYILWSRIYAREINYSIEGNYRDKIQIAKKNKWNINDPLFNYNKHYMSKVLDIIVKNKKYLSMDKALKEKMGESLFNSVLNYGL